MDPLLTVGQLSKYLQVKESTIRDWCHTQFIPFIKVGRLVRFREKDVLKWLQLRSIKGRRCRKLEDINLKL